MNGESREVRAPAPPTPRRPGARRRFRGLSLVLGGLVLAACGTSGSGQSGSAFVFLSVDLFSLDGKTPTGAVNSSIDDPSSSTVVCVTLRNTRKNPTVTLSTALDNVTIQSYTVVLHRLDGSTLLGPFTFGASVLVPADVTVGTSTSNNFSTFAIIVVPGSAKLDPAVRPPNRLPLPATATVIFKGRDGRGSGVEVQAAVTVIFITGGSDSTVSCGGSTGTTTTTTTGTGGTSTTGTTTTP